MGRSGWRRCENTFSISARYSAAVRVRTVSMWATKHTRPSLMPPRATVVLPISMAKIIFGKPFLICKSQPSPSAHPRCHLPQRGRFYVTGQRFCFQALPSGELSSAARLRGFGSFHSKSRVILPHFAFRYKCCKKILLCWRQFCIILKGANQRFGRFLDGSERKMRPFGRHRRHCRL